MKARDQLKIPMILGSCGTCGTDNMVDHIYDMTIDLAAELGHSLTIARIYAERKNEDICTAYRDGQIQPLAAAPPLDAEKIERFSHIVSLAGVEPLQEALQAGADIILAGRTTDTAVIAALPLMRGMHPGASWHGAKIAECGAFCSSHPATGVILLEVDKGGFTVEPMAAGAVCTPIQYRPICCMKMPTRLSCMNQAAILMCVRPTIPPWIKGVCVLRGRIG